LKLLFISGRDLHLGYLIQHFIRCTLYPFGLLEHRLRVLLLHEREGQDRQLWFQRLPRGLHHLQLILAGGNLLLGGSVGGHHDVEGRLLLELVGITLGAQVSLTAEQDLLQMIQLQLLSRGNDPELIAWRGWTLKDHKLVR